MERMRRRNEFLALWLTPTVSVIPLVPLFAIRSSPLFLGKLMDDPTHPMAWPVLGPLLSGTGLMFDGILLASLVVGLLVTPVWLALRPWQLSARRVYLILVISGVLAAQFAGVIAREAKQPDLRAAGASWTLLLLGCLSGLVAAAFCNWFTRKRISELTKTLLFITPVFAMIVSASLLTWAGYLWRSH